MTARPPNGQGRIRCQRGMAPPWARSGKEVMQTEVERRSDCGSVFRVPRAAGCHRRRDRCEASHG